MANYNENPHQLYHFLNEFIKHQKPKSILYINEYRWVECSVFLEKCTCIRKIEDLCFETIEKFDLVVAMLPLGEPQPKHHAERSGFSKRFEHISPGYIYSLLCKSIAKDGRGIFISSNSGLGDDFYYFCDTEKYHVNSIVSLPIQMNADFSKSTLTTSIVSREKKDFSVYVMGSGTGISVHRSGEFAADILGTGQILATKVYKNSKDFVSINETLNNISLQKKISTYISGGEEAGLICLERFGAQLKSITKYNIFDVSSDFWNQNTAIFIKDVMDEDNCIDIWDLVDLHRDFYSKFEETNGYWPTENDVSGEEFWVWRLEFFNSDDSVALGIFYRMLFKTSIGKTLCESFYQYFEKISFSEKNCRNALMPVCLPAVARNLVLRQFMIEEARDYFVELQDRFFLENPGKSFNELIKAKFLDDADSIIAEIERGENASCEFKSTFELNLHTGISRCEKVRLASLKTIAGFLNTNGGKLFIGVKDNGDIAGIVEEARLSHKGNFDKFKLRLKQMVKNSFGNAVLSLYIDVQDKEVYDKKIFVVKVRRSPIPVFVEDDFYVRVNPRTEKLMGAEVVRYCKEHFATNSSGAPRVL